LAAGRPVVTQETGFSKHLPTGKGLFGFRTADDILTAVDAIESDYPGNCRAAREIAAECFAAEKGVGSLMRRAGGWAGARGAGGAVTRATGGRRRCESRRWPPWARPFAGRAVTASNRSSVC